jgi:hypothetical protein
VEIILSATIAMPIAMTNVAHGRGQVMALAGWPVLIAGIPGNEANSLANRARECRGSRVRQLANTNSVRRISERKSAAKSVGGREMQQTLAM